MEPHVRSRTLALIVVAGMPWACTLPDFSLEGRPCPCAEGYLCDESTNTCTSSLPSDGGGGGTGGAGLSGGGGSSAGGGGSSAGGQGGSACDPPLAPPFPSCADLAHTFDDQTSFLADWDPYPTATVFDADGDLTVQLPASDNVSFATTTTGFTFDDCAIWVAIAEASTASDVMTRLSFAEGLTSTYNLGVLQGNLQARDGQSVVLASTPYDARAMRHVRIRSDSGTLYFEHSDDALCWTELHAEPLDTPPVGNGRIVLTRVDASTGDAATARFDDYGVTP